MYEGACAKAGKTPEKLDGAGGLAAGRRSATAWCAKGEDVSLTQRQVALGPDVTGLQELILYGLKGAAAYADHAQMLGYEDPDLYATFHEALDFLTRENPTADELLGWVMKTGELNLKVMELLDAANTGTYGHPEPTAGPRHADQGQVHPRFRPRPEGPRRTARSRPRARASTSTPTARCSPATPIRA